ncbi:unnamed protein product [Caenorhabditis angaria]|uniref:Uncharacterized protein n=1 Tax=Caenorhabditis angaria TaxID=860376 RepID=A0A9P1IKJ8_9PELO|nr:unnamed protein product [Caenorhabditis angaria]
MSNTKKRKSDVNIDTCGTSSSDPKKDRPWFHDDPFNIQPSNDAKSSRRKSFLGNMLHKLKPSKDSHKSMSKLESLNHSDAHSSINSESSITSTESSKIPNIEKNAGLRTFVNRDSFTPVPPIDDKNEDALSTSSKMSVETADSFNLNDAMCHNATTSVFCTPSRTLNRNSNSRISTRSVPDHHVFQDSDESSANMFNSLCNSVRRAPSTKSEGGGVNSMFGSQAMRRSGRLQFNRRHMNASNMEDVPEEEPLASVTPAQTLCNEDGDEEVFVNGKEFFADNTTESNDTNQRTSIDSSRLSIASEHRKTPGSVGRNNSILRKILPSKWNQKERRTSELGDEAVREANDRRLSIISFGAEENNGIDMTNNSEKNCENEKENNIFFKFNTTSFIGF